MTYQLETIAGQAFVRLSSTDGRKRTLTPLAAIADVKASIKSINAQRQAIEDEASGIVASMRQCLSDGSDTNMLRIRMSELKRLDSELIESLASSNEQINTIRSATTRAEAESIANAAHANIAAALSPLELGDLA